MSKLPPVYSPAEEKTNVWTHAAGAVIALAGVIGAFFIAPPSGVAGTAGYLVYGVSLVLMYVASACYHGVSEPSRRALLRRFDHAAIYLLIAGTYTPVLLLAVGGRLGAWMLAAIWSRKLFAKTCSNTCPAAQPENCRAPNRLTRLPVSCTTAARNPLRA